MAWDGKSGGAMSCDGTKRKVDDDDEGKDVAWQNGTWFAFLVNFRGEVIRSPHWAVSACLHAMQEVILHMHPQSVTSGHLAADERRFI